ncbi:hypothetical protein A2U01_0095380, partial [Trifolium medium]|nr:hypothetical protein [Trifolium medium]
MFIKHILEMFGLVLNMRINLNLHPDPPPPSPSSKTVLSRCSRIAW